MEAKNDHAAATVFAGNLAWSTTTEMLHEFVSSANVPDLVDCEVKRHDDTKRSKGWGLIYFSKSESAVNALSLLGAKELDGRVPHLRLDRSQLELQDELINLYIGNLPWNLSEEQLMTIFSDVSPVSCHVLTNMYGRSRGFAIMKFANEEQMTIAIEKYHHFEVSGRKLECRPDRGPGKADPSNGKKSVFVGKLPADIEDESLSTMFASMGVVNSKVERHADGLSKGWGIVKFESESAAKAAVDSMEGSPFEVRFDRK